MKDFKPKSTAVKGGSWTSFAGLCKSCGLCLSKCPNQALVFSQELGIASKPIPQVLPEKCNLCNICETVCPECAIRIDKE